MRIQSHWFAAAILAGCATPVHVPAALEPPANETLAMVVPASGVQIYECRAKKDSAGYEWAFVAPEAQLSDRAGRTIGSHGAGPSWQARDGSRIVGTVKQRADAPQSAAIPWLLLSAKSDGPEGAFSKVTSIQRVNTVGGIATATGCAAATSGTRSRVAYTADYDFVKVN
jgi:hypothetical protein